MKKIILFVSFLFTFSLINAQIKLYNKAGAEINGDTLVFDHLLDTTAFNIDFEHKDIVIPKNESTDTMIIDVIREEINFIPGTGDYFCWGTQCFGEVAAGTRTSWKANDAVTTAPDSTAGGIGFAVYLAHKNKLGEAFYKYTFVNDLDSRERSSIYVKYNVYAEELSLTNNNNESIKNQTVLDWRAIDTSNRVEYFKINNTLNLTNNTGNLMKIALSRDEVSVLNNVADSIIWNGISYSKSISGLMTNRSFPDTILLQPNQSLSNPIELFYFANDNIGESQYRFNLNITTNGSSSTVSYDIKIGTSYLTSVNDKWFNENFSIYPNPSSEIFNVTFDSKYSNENNQINIFNIVGEKVYERNLNSGEYNLEINTDQLESGVYFVNILSKDKLLGSKKLIVK